MINRDYRNSICFFGLRVCALLVAACWSSGSANAEPRMTNMPIRGLQVGGTTLLTIQGSDLLPNPKLIVDVPIAKQVVAEKSTATRLEIEVTLAANATPGLYNLRLANDNGISRGVVIAVDKLPQTIFGERIDKLPAAVHGATTGSQIAGTLLSGKAGQELLVEVEAQRLGSKLRPVVHLYDQQRRQVALALPSPTLGGDARLEAKLPADGEYKLEIHDLQYTGANPGHFRLKVGDFQYADMVFPPVVEHGKQTSLQFIGNIGIESRIQMTGNPGESFRPAPWPQLAAASGPRPRVLVSELPELIETVPSETPQVLPSIPVAVSGRLDAAGQEDVYRIAVSAGMKLRCEVFAERLGAPIDAVLEIRNDKGARLAQNDDIAGTTDPRLDYTVPAKVESIDLALRDQLDRGEQRSIYRLVISQVDDKGQRPGIRLKVTEDTHNVPLGGATVFQVVAERRGYDGPIRLAFDNLPTSVIASAGVIPAGSNGTLVKLRGAGQQAESIITCIRGRSVGIEPPLTATAVFEKHPLGKLQPWMQNDVALSLAPANDWAFEVDWSQPAASTQLVLGGTFAAPARVRRPPGAIGPVRWSLVSGEPPLTVNGRVDNNRSLRAQTATVDIPVDPKAKAAFDALTAAKKAVTVAQSKAKTVRETGTKTVTAAAAAAKTALNKKAAVEKARAAAAAAQKSAAAARDTAAKAKQAAEAESAGAEEDAKPVAKAKLKVATEQLAAANKALADADAKLKTAVAAFAAAEKAHAAQTAQLNKAKADSDKAVAAADKAVADAEAKQKSAETALTTAETAIKSDAKFNIIVPPNFSTAACDLALKAELRSLDNKRVLAVAYTPVRRFAPLNPLALALSGEPTFSARLDAKTGAVVKLSGTIERKAGFAGDLTVTTTGQPGGVAAPKVVLKPDKNKFELELKFPANFKPSEVKSIKLVASGPPNPKAANIVVRTEQPIVVRILPAEEKQKETNK